MEQVINKLNTNAILDQTDINFLVNRYYSLSDVDEKYYISYLFIQMINKKNFYSEQLFQSIVEKISNKDNFLLLAMIIRYYYSKQLSLNVYLTRKNSIFFYAELFNKFKNTQNIKAVQYMYILLGFSYEQQVYLNNPMTMGEWLTYNRLYLEQNYFDPYIATICDKNTTIQNPKLIIESRSYNTIALLPKTHENLYLAIDYYALGAYYKLFNDKMMYFDVNHMISKIILHSNDNTLLLDIQTLIKKLNLPIDVEQAKYLKLPSNTNMSNEFLENTIKAAKYSGISNEEFNRLTSTNIKNILRKMNIDEKYISDLTLELEKYTMCHALYCKMMEDPIYYTKFYSFMLEELKIDSEKKFNVNPNSNDMTTGIIVN